MSNLKIFQQALEKVANGKKIDVNKLAKARYQDNLEMIQWLKRYLEMTSTKISQYDPVARRNGEHFYSHNSQKNSYVNKPGRNLNVSFNTTSKKETSISHENPRNDKM